MKWKPDDQWAEEHPRHTKADWMYEVANGDTLSGYIDWVNHQIEMLEDEDEDAGLESR